MRITPGQPIDIAVQQQVLGLVPDGPAVAPDVVDPTAPSAATGVAAAGGGAGAHAGGYGADGRSGHGSRDGGLVDLFA